ncbi:MAG TPA: extracellular solute-binding protein [Acholeplasma sp.]|nr:extracellular solute-binding protein [Acholeplasma sp.]
MSKEEKKLQEQEVEEVKKEAVAIEDVKITTVNYDLVDSSESKLKRKTNRVKMIKRAIWITILVLLVTIITVSIVKSFRPDRTTSDSYIPEELYPEGDYNNYIRAKATGISDPQRLAVLDFNKDVKPLIVKPQVEDITVDITLGTPSANAIDFKYMDVDDPNNSIVLPNGEKKAGYYTSETGSITFPVDIPEAGFYYLKVEYYAEKLRDESFNVRDTSGGANVERIILINGELPFESARNIRFYRMWKDKGEIIQDINGNDMKPSQMEIFDVNQSYIRDYTGYVVNPYMFYFKAGANTITFDSIRENMSIISLTVEAVPEVVTYQDYLNQHQDKNEPSNVMLQVEAENSTKRSSPTLYAIADRTSPTNTPSHPVKITLNSIGGTKWTAPGDWIEWEVDVEEAGMYELSFKAKQNTARGLFSTRRLYINGEIPFIEANNSNFNYSTNWRLVTLGNSEEKYKFYFHEGINTIRLESTLGAYGGPINQVKNVVNDLNNMYLQIISITTVNPDPYQEYHLYGDNARIVGLLECFEENAIRLREVSEHITQLSGEKGSLVSVLDTMAIQLESFLEKPRTIQERLGTFVQNLSSLGTWITSIQEQSLTVEALYVSSSDAELPKPNADWFSGTWFDIKAFFMTFFFDYQSIGVTHAEGFDKEIEVWFLTSAVAGREQANALKTLSDTTFTNQYGINVILKVVDPGVLLPATLAGTGPDVALNVYNGLPVNYALRNASYDISQFDDFKYEVTEYGVRLLINGESTPRFADSAMTPYALQKTADVNDLEFYALPITQSFLVTFYRKDIFEERGWTVPKTWDEVTSLVTELQISNLQFYLPLSAVGASAAVNQVFASMLFQNGGSFYTEDKTATALDREEALQSFETWVKYYTDYSFPTAASFLNRFRTGETPIGVVDYTNFNYLAVFAPEITGKWGFAPIPGVKDSETGIVNNKGAASGSAGIIMKQTKDPESSWEFLKWVTSAPTQLSYAQELESILGSAARHNTANMDAFKSMAWTTEEKEVLLSQWVNTVGIPEVAGGYYTGRNVENAFRKTINEKKNPREILLTYVNTINAELTKKRKEFGFITREDIA